MATQNASEVAARWASRMAGSTDRIQAGIQGTSVAPGQAAARQKSVYIQQVQAKADKWARNVSAVPLGEWQQAAINKGLPRIACGAQAAQPKVQDFMQSFLPHVANVQASLPARGTIDQNIDRMVKNVRGMAAFKR